jgi:multiple sugar transport system substrate-binding protein
MANSISRGRFLRNAGIGAAGLAAGSVLPGLSQPLGVSFAGGEMVVSYWSPVTPEKPLDDLLAQFGTQNGIKVTYFKEPQVFGDTVQKLTTYLSSGYTGLDLYWLDNFMTATFSNAGWLLPLEDKVSKATIAAMSPFSVKLTTYNGHVYAVPGYAGGVLFFYRKDVLNKLGIAVPRTWADMRAASIKITKSSGSKMYGMGFAGKNGNTELFNEMCFWMGQAGASPLNLKTPGARVALQWVWDNLNTYKILPPDTVTADYTSLSTAFQNDRFAMWPVWGGFLQQFQTNAKFMKHAQVAVALPAKGPKNNHTIADSWAWAISKYSKNQDLAVKFIEYMSTPQAMNQMALTGRLPSRYSVLNHLTPAAQKVLGDQTIYLALYDKYGLRSPRPITAQAQRISDAFESVINQYLNKQISLDAAINTAQQQIDQIQQNS